MKNGDKIREMSNEELAEMIINMGCTKCERLVGKCLVAGESKSCGKLVEEWLESECDVELEQ